MRTPATASGQNKQNGRLQKRNLSPIPRRKREFVPENKKDSTYWTKREKNNDAAKKSRERRRLQDMESERRVMALMGENERLRVELLTLRCRLGLTGFPPRSQTLSRGALAGLLPDLGALRYAPTLDRSQGAPLSGLGYRESALSAVGVPQLSAGAWREGALCLADVLRQPPSKGETVCSKENLHCAKCQVESYASSHLSKLQDHQLLARGFDSGAVCDLETSGTQINCPQRLRFKTSEDGESGHQRQNCLSLSSSKGGVLEIYVDPQMTHFAADIYHHRGAGRGEPHLSFNVEKRFLFPWGLAKGTEPPSETGLCSSLPTNNSSAQKPDVKLICDRGNNYTGKGEIQRKFNTSPVEIGQLKRWLVPGSC
ncbi:uncharacterized protein LOC144479749 [Mustelus asterias]